MKNIGLTLKTLREQNGLTRREVSEKLSEYGIDISDKTLYGYESGRSSANADMFLALCKVYNCTNILSTFDDATEDVLFTNAEWELIEKYRTLDEHGKELVNFTLDKEYERCQSRNAAGQISLFDIASPADIEELKKITNSPKANFSDDFMKFFEEFPFESEIVDFPDMNYESTTTVQAARNNFETEPGEQKKMQKDIENLKKPE